MKDQFQLSDNKKALKNTCGMFLNIAPLYSEPLWKELSSSELTEYYFYSSRMGYSSIKTIDIKESKTINEAGSFRWFFLKNIYFKGILIWQTGAVYKCIVTDYDAYIFNGEMNCLSSWFAAFVCRLRNKPVIFWGHGLYGNEGNLKKNTRKLFYKIANYHLVYGNRSKGLMIQSGFSENRVLTVYNSLNFHLHNRFYEEKNSDELKNLRKKLFPATPENQLLIFLGRLTKEKKVHYLIRALHLLRSRGKSYNCLVVGKGTEMQSLKDMTNNLGLNDSVNFYGECYDEEVNASFIMMSDCCISPGNIGLTAIHSLALGTPVITHGNFARQGPEVEVIVPGKTGKFFIEDDLDDLAFAIEDFATPGRKVLLEAECRKVIKESWTPENQRAIFDDIVNKAINSTLSRSLNK